MRGLRNKQLREMQEKAWESNRGKPRSQETKDKISSSRRANRISQGAICSYVFGIPLHKRDGHWAYFENGKRKIHARSVYEKYKGQIPKGYVIHHIDGNPLNDSIDNLFCMPRKEHYMLHLYWDMINHWTNRKISGKEILERFKHWRDYEGCNIGWRDRLKT